MVRYKRLESKHHTYHPVYCVKGDEIRYNSSRPRRIIKNRKQIIDNEKIERLEERALKR